MPLRATQKKFLSILLVIWLAIPGRVNAANFARYSGMNEKTLRNWFGKAWDWQALHTTVVEALLEQQLIGQSFILAIDATFIPKAGKKTAGVGYFWDGCAGQAGKGLELSCCALIDVQGHHAFTINVRQTQPKTEKADRQLQYQSHLNQTFSALPTELKVKIRAVVADGQYANRGFMQLADQHGLPLITKLQCRAHLMYRYRGTHPQRKGRKKKWDGKVDFKDYSRWEVVSEDLHERVLTKVVYAPHFKRDLRVVVVQRLNSCGKVKAHAVLCSTDITVSAGEVQVWYKARFQLEFTFRDGKQFAGLTTCQLRSTLALEAHWNTSLLVVSLVRAQAIKDAGNTDFVFSMEDAKRRAYNELFARHILSNLDLEAQFEELISMPSKPLHFGLKAA